MKFTCLNCGQENVRTRIDKRFCSNRCYKAYRSKHEHPAPPVLQCLHNEGVECQGGNCSGCGWNPEVEQERKAEILRRLGV